MAQTVFGHAELVPTSTGGQYTLVYKQIVITNVASSVTPSQFTYSPTTPPATGTNLDLHLIYNGGGNSIPEGTATLILNYTNLSSLPTNNTVPQLTDGTIYIYPPGDTNDSLISPGPIDYGCPAVGAIDDIVIYPTLTYEQASNGLYTYTVGGTISLPNTYSGSCSGEALVNVAIFPGDIINPTYTYNFTLPDSTPTAATTSPLPTFTFSTNYLFLEMNVYFNAVPTSGRVKRVKGIANSVKGDWGIPLA